MRWRIPLLLLGLIAVTAAGGAQAIPNHLNRQQSAYLKRAVLQPIDWYPWEGQAFQRAKELNHPILVDVGAVWCPSCKVMDRDTCGNAETADYINQHFIAVKVDFDASPTLVAQLQPAQAILNRAGRDISAP